MAYNSFASGILVKEGKVLLVHHNRFDKWVFPGGHIDEDETPTDAAAREFKEETSVDVEVLSNGEYAFSGDDNDTPIPLPFYMGLAKEGFDVPHVGYYYYVKPTSEEWTVNHQQEELYGIGWYSKEDLDNLQTFNQVKSICKFAIDNYPKE